MNTATERLGCAALLLAVGGVTLVSNHVQSVLGVVMVFAAIVLIVDMIIG